MPYLMMNTDCLEQLYQAIVVIKLFHFGCRKIRAES